MASAGVADTLVVRLLTPILPELRASQLSEILASLGGEYAAASARNGKRPKLPNTPADLAIAQRLETVELAKSHSLNGSKIRVNMKRS